MRQLVLSATLLTAAWLPSRAEASCAGSDSCELHTLEVVSCAVLNPALQPGVARYTQELETRGQRAEARRVLASYSAAVLTVKVSATQRVKRSDPKVRKLPTLLRMRHGSEPAYLVTPASKGVCSRYPAGKVVEVQVAQPCCDGDPGMPCLLSNRVVLEGDPPLPPPSGGLGE